MCYHLSITKKREYIEDRFSATFIEPVSFEPVYHASAFASPFLPVISDEDTEHIRMLQWGLIPFWAKDDEKAEKMRYYTINARAETIFEKPSFKNSIRKKRCIVISDGFYDWREVDGKKYPYYIHFSDNRVFALAGIWDVWEKGKVLGKKTTFSVITTKANPLIEKVHNRKKRMPVILKRQDEKRWICRELSTEEIKSLFVPFEEKEMEVYPVSRLITSKDKNTNVIEVMKRNKYENVDLDI